MSIPPPASLQSEIQSEKNWQFICRIIAQIATRLFVSLIGGYLLYLVLPLSVHATILPLALFSTVFAASFLFTVQGIRSLVGSVFSPPPNPLPGIENGAQNCWANSLAQTMHCDKAMYEWFYHFPREWVPEETLEEQMPESIQTIPFLTPQMLQDAQVDGENQEGNLEIQAYRRRVEEAPLQRRYIQFFANVPVAERSARWKGLVAFHQFFHAYQKAKEDSLAVVPFSSQKLRLALHALNHLIEEASDSQQDPMEGLSALGDALLPDDLKVSFEMRHIYHQDEFPPIRGGDSRARREGLQLSCIVLNLGTQPNLQTMVDAFAAYTPDARLSLEDVNGVRHDYRIARIEQKFVTAPSALWLQLKRMHREPTSSNERGNYVFKKLNTAVLAQDQIHIQTLEPVNEGIFHYQLDGFIVHLGSTLNLGHYKSYRRIEGDWFEMNDSRVRRITSAEQEEASAQAYAYHYTKLAP